MMLSNHDVIPQTVRTIEPARPSMALAVYSLSLRELIRFFRQRTRIVGALGQPIIFWVLFGAGLQSSFRGPADLTYQEYFFPGVAIMIVMFTAIFSTISIIEDRREGFLQGVLVAPVSRASLVLGKVCGGTILAVLQALFFLLIGPVLALGRIVTANIDRLDLVQFFLRDWLSRDCGICIDIAWLPDCMADGFDAWFSRDYEHLSDAHVVIVGLVLSGA